MELKIRTMAEYAAAGEVPDILFWVGCAGSFDQRAQKITKAIAKILQHIGIPFAVLGTEESCTGDPAKRAGNEFLFQMQAMTNIQVLNGYQVTRIVTGCPHCFNTLTNEYPQLGGKYEVLHHSELLSMLIREKRLPQIQGGNAGTITFHDPCYLGGHMRQFDAPRAVLGGAGETITEMERAREKSFCCGSGGGHAFTVEPPNQCVNLMRAHQRPGPQR